MKVLTLLALTTCLVDAECSNSWVNYQNPKERSLCGGAYCGADDGYWNNDCKCQSGTCKLLGKCETKDEDALFFYNACEDKIERRKIDLKSDNDDDKDDDWEDDDLDWISWLVPTVGVLVVVAVTIIVVCCIKKRRQRDLGANSDA